MQRCSEYGASTYDQEANDSNGSVGTERLDLAGRPFFKNIRRQLKHITDPGYGHYVTGMSRVLLDFAAQLSDHYAKRFGFFRILRTPDHL